MSAPLCFSFIDPRPLCSRCARRSARPCPTGGFYKHCLVCNRESQRNTAAERRARTTVFRLLGGRCTCPGTRCWHAGECPVDLWDALTVHHQHHNGSEDRRSRMGRPQNFCRWSRYLRRLRRPNHGLSLRCASCHQVLTCLDRAAARARRN